MTPLHTRVVEAMARDAEQRYAYFLVRKAILSGALKRPAVCSSCGFNPGLAADGRSKIHAHHHVGYQLPLDVMWLCAKCHRKETPMPEKIGGVALGDRNGMRIHPDARPRGSKNGFSKLVEADVLDIKTRRLKSRDFAALYGVSKCSVNDILSGRTWAWLAAAPSPWEDGE